MHQTRSFSAGSTKPRADRDDRALAEVFAEDVVPGRSAIAGEYRGIEWVMEYIRWRRELMLRSPRIR